MRVQVWPQHWHAWQVFLGMATQWRVASDGHSLRYVGLDYNVLPLVLREQRVPRRWRQPRRALMQQLRVLEAAARNALNEA